MGPTGTGPMARTRATGDRAAGRVPKVGRPPVEAPKRNIVTLRGSEEWRAWLHRFAEHARVQGSTLVDHALTHYAKELGFEPPPKR